MNNTTRFLAALLPTAADIARVAQLCGRSPGHVGKIVRNGRLVPSQHAASFARAVSEVSGQSVTEADVMFGRPELPAQAEAEVDSIVAEVRMAVRRAVAARYVDRSKSAA